MADVMPSLQPGDPASAQRACPKCSAHNPPTAGFCWQCFAPLAAPVESVVPSSPSRGIRPGWPPQQPTSAAGLPDPARSTAAPGGLRLAAIILAALVVSGVGALVVGKLLRTHVSLPASVAGYSRTTTPQITQGIEQFHKQMHEQGIDADLAVYGGAAGPRLSLIWYHDPSGPDAEAAFKAFSAGFGTSGSRIDTASMTTENVEGVDYLCAPVAGNVRGAVCM